MNGRGARGFGMLELVVVGMLVAVLIAIAMTGWRGHIAQQRLRYGVAQVAADLRQAHERAKAERAPYTVTFVASGSGYSIVRDGGGFSENAVLPEGVTTTADLVVAFSAFGRPGAEHTITVQNTAGAASAWVNEAGGITYQEP
ncbi:MAG: hypothetical protein QME77_04535 [bacterium]|nr:hypothetical protein [bacterium]